MEQNGQPDEFTLELATRIALHEVLLVQLFGDRLLNRPNTAQLLETVGGATESIMGALGQGAEDMNAYQAEFTRQQRELGQTLARNFFRKVASSRPAE